MPDAEGEGVNSDQAPSGELQLADNLLLPPEIVTAKVAILANSGAGKSYTAMKLGELMLSAGAQIVALDPVGIWYGLLSSSDGKGPGFPVLVFGGAHGHLALSPRAGAAVAAFLVESGASCVLDLSDMLPDELSEFVADFARALLRERRKRPSPMHLFFEEADNFSPQRLKGSKSFHMQLAVAKLLKEGRHAGIGWSVISQRAQDVDKTVLDLAETLVALRTVKGWARVKEWLTSKDLEASPELQRQLAELETGGAVVISPFLSTDAWRRIHVRPRVTFDVSKTPELGAAPITPKLAEVDLSALRTQMETIMAQIEEGDPQALQRRVGEQAREIERLRAALAAKPTPPAEPAAAPEALERLRREADEMSVQLQALLDALLSIEKATQKERSGAQTLRDRAMRLQHGLSEELTRVVGPALREEHIGSTLNELLEGEGAHEADPSPATHPEVAAKRWTPQKLGSLSLCATSILWVFAWSGPRGSELHLHRTLLAVRSLYSINGSGFHAALSELRDAGLIERGATRGTFRLLPAGQARVAELAERPEPPGPSTLAEVRQAWLGRPRFSRGAKNILDVLLREGSPLTKPQLAERTGYSENSSSFHAAICELAALGLVERRGRRNPTVSVAPVLVGEP